MHYNGYCREWHSSPNHKKAAANLDRALDSLTGISPDYVSVTFGAGGSTREGSFELIDKLKLPNFTAVSNGTIALQMAIKALNLQGEIITTPFTWIATVSAIKWEGCTPVFCDIDPGTLNIDPSKIESLINDNTVAIMPVHVFGNPCDVDVIGEIARKHGLKIIYDAAHAIGSTYQDRSLLEFGDISATSLHATKLLNTAEGGGCITKDLAIYEKLKKIAELMERTAVYLDREIRRLIDTALTLLEPLVILFMGAIIMFIVLATLLPIFSMEQLVS